MTRDDIKTLALVIIAISFVLFLIFGADWSA